MTTTIARFERITANDPHNVPLGTGLEVPCRDGQQDGTCFASLNTERHMVGPREMMCPICGTTRWVPYMVAPPHARTLPLDVLNRWVYFWKYLTAVRDLATKIWKSYEQGGSMHNKFKAVLTARKNARRRAAELPTSMDLGPNLDDHLERQRRRGSEDGSVDEETGFRRPGITDILLAEHRPVLTPVYP